MVLKLLVAVARRGEASIVGGDLRAPAGFVLQLVVLRRDTVKLTGVKEAGMGVERVGVKSWSSGRLYL
jgi:hypothetical protein